ncbi:AIPR protein [Nonomuraea polychroma]|uniref:AIPR protein n=1 Tax=Nonomuraea polychroma TaxID=46176 RepID=A0A438MHL2_9ACTN|nr:AIPR family protein [Nonomuraea polychroma]RVX44931.1 AIPR protein [Nonomuraea polychroma]
MTEVALEDFARGLVANVLTTAEAEDTTAPEMFTQLMLDDLEVAGEIENQFLAYHKAHGLEIHGFGSNKTLSSLDLVVTEFRQIPLMDKLTKAQSDAAFKRPLQFLRKHKDIKEAFDEASDVHDLCVGVEKALAEASRIRVFLLTNCISTSKAPAPSLFDELEVTYELWDLRRFHRLASSGAQSEPVVVEFERPLACLAAPAPAPDLAVVLSVVPGQVLADLYHEYGTRLLELNVRSFLQTRAKVNGGIRKTLLGSPKWFLAYNNGITATASQVDFIRSDDGHHAIKRIYGLQIVNGGQTTASIYYAHSRDKADLSEVHVQMKLTVLPESRLSEVVPEISKYSNTQNAVTLVDFSSNNPFHVAVERVTRTLWAPAADGSGVETRWFYERARGQYTDAEAKARTPANRRKFKLQHPTKQKFSKTDLAKYIHCWEMLPHLVSRGAQKNFSEFMIKLEVAVKADQVPRVDVRYCQRLIAKAKLFKDIDRIAQRHQAGSNKSFVTAYTMSLLVKATNQRLDLDRIWREQGVSPALAAAVEGLVDRVMAVINNPRGGNHSGEWAKKAECWERVCRIHWSVPADLEAELLPEPVIDPVGPSPESTDEMDLPEEVVLVGEIAPEEWFSIQRWAKETQSLTPDQRQRLAVVGRRLQNGEPIRVDVAVEALKLRAMAISAGFHA